MPRLILSAALVVGVAAPGLAQTADADSIPVRAVSDLEAEAPGLSFSADRLLVQIGRAHV